MTNKHTELPWSVINGEAVVGADKTWVKPYETDSWEGDRKWPDRNEAKANAHLIVTAVNNHHLLREALEDMVADASDNGYESICTEKSRLLLAELDNMENGS